MLKIEIKMKTFRLIETVWVGTNPYTGYKVKVNIKNGSKCIVTVYTRKSNLYNQKECNCLYCDTTGTFSCEYNNHTITGKIEGNTMTLTDEYGTYTLTKK